MLDDEWLARIHYIVGRNPGPRPDVDVKALEADIRAAIRTWDDGFAEAVRLDHGELPSGLVRRYANAFPGDYREAITPTDAVADIGRVEAVLKGEGGAGTYRRACLWQSGRCRERAAPEAVRAGQFVPLSDCLPVFENLGLKVIAEQTFALSRSGRRRQAGLRLAAQFPDGARRRQDPPTSCA